MNKENEIRNNIGNRISIGGTKKSSYRNKKLKSMLRVTQNVTLATWNFRGI